MAFLKSLENSKFTTNKFKFNDTLPSTQIKNKAKDGRIVAGRN